MQRNINNILRLIMILLIFSISASSENNNLVVHEWGTFTSIAGKNEQMLDWRPLNGSSDLPSFVYQYNKSQNDPCSPQRKINLVAQVRMETPVIYFYSDREATVDVKVAFPKGHITEWYPKACLANTVINWGTVFIDPKSSTPFPRNTKESHYYPARETDAASIAVLNKMTGKLEHEKFLFYRGVGTFALPLSVQLEKEQIKIKSRLADKLGTIFVFENHAGKIGYQAIKLAGSETIISRPALQKNVAGILTELENSLLAQGLYEKEAKAMLKTWQDSWFEEGLRVFYFTPPALADEILPLTITPKPVQTVRVLVGRIEILTPEFEQKIKNLATRINDDPGAEKEMLSLGRFAEPILNDLLSRIGDERLKAKLLSILQAREKE